MKPFEYEGLWWLPAAPEQKCSGSLRCDDTGELHLTLMGALVDRSVFMRGDELPLIHGEVFIDERGQTITLKDCFVTSMSGVIGRHTPRQKIFGHRAFIGAHLSDKDDFEFESVHISLSGLNAWAHSLTGFDKSHADPWVIAFKHPEPLSGEIPGGWFTLGIGCSSSGTRREHRLAEETSLALTFRQPVSDSVLHNDYVSPLQNLFTFATDHPNSLTQIAVRRVGKIGESITVIGAQIFSDESVAAELLPWQMLFSLPDVANRLEGVLTKWLDLSHRFRQATAVYFSTQYDPPRYVDMRFPLVVQALALYHDSRSTRGAAVLADEISKCAGALVREQADALQKILYSHPVVMAERALKDLTEENRTLFGPLVAVEGGIEKFVEKTLGMLEYVLTRRADNPWSNSFGREVYWLTERVSFLLRICFLNELGFAPQDRDALLQKNQRYGYLRDQVGRNS